MRFLALASLAAAQDFPALFEEFKTAHNKVYKSTEEELERLKNFIKNVETAHKMNGLDNGSATYGHLSPLADLSELEFANYNTLQVTKELLAKHEKAARTVYSEQLPDKYDWRDKGAVTPVKNQAQCGSCWAFSTVCNIEGQNFITNGKLISLSEQELVDCDKNDNGCNGGLPSNAYKDLISNNQGLELESSYGYTARGGACQADAKKEVVFLKSWVPISTAEDDIASALMKYGPLSIGINAGPMQMYMGGIADPWFCNPAALDHGVAIVAFGKEDYKQFWVIKNSWGGSWGEEGYYR